jgi:hypothetical protein
MNKLNIQKLITANPVLDDRFVDARQLYLCLYEALPSLSYIGNIDGEKGFAAFMDRYAGMIEHDYQYRWFHAEKRAFQFDETVLILNNRTVVKFDDHYCQVLHDGSQQAFINEVAFCMRQFKERTRKQPLEINLIVQSKRGLELKSMEIKRTKLDLDLFYEDDFKATDAVIRQRLSSRNDKGIVLLHGLPGTGKTTYLRHLIGRIKKRVLFLSPSVAENLMNPEFVELLVDNPNTVVIIEDAEHIIMDRKFSSGSSVSNLLNISDGLLADFLNVQLVCTFNSALATIDSALLRKGRLIAKYEFGRLSVQKAQRLSDHLGVNTVVRQPMSIAEVANQKEQGMTSEMQERMIGFKQHMWQPA